MYVLSSIWRGPKLFKWPSFQFTKSLSFCFFFSEFFTRFLWHWDSNSFLKLVLRFEGRFQNGLKNFMPFAACLLKSEAFDSEVADETNCGRSFGGFSLHFPMYWQNLCTHCNRASYFTTAEVHTESRLLTGAVILHGHDNWKITENFTLDLNKLHGKITENV